MPVTLAGTTNPGPCCILLKHILVEMSLFTTSSAPSTSIVVQAVACWQAAMMLLISLA